MGNQLWGAYSPCAYGSRSPSQSVTVGNQPRGAHSGMTLWIHIWGRLPQRDTGWTSSPNLISGDAQNNHKATVPPDFGLFL